MLVLDTYMNTHLHYYLLYLELTHNNCCTRQDSQIRNMHPTLFWNFSNLNAHLLPCCLQCNTWHIFSTPIHPLKITASTMFFMKLSPTNVALLCIYLLIPWYYECANMILNYLPKFIVFQLSGWYLLLLG
jgi:hypothetical protein